MAILKNPLWGVDIGHRSLKGVSLKKVRNRVKLNDYFFVDLTLSNSEETHLSKVNKALKATVETNEIQRTNAVSSVYTKFIDSFEILLPHMPKKDIQAAIKHEITNHVNFSPENINFDYIEMLNTSSESSKNSELRLKVFYIHNKHINEQTNLLESSGLKAKAIDLDSLAIVSCLKFNDYLKADKIYVVIDLGESHTTVSLVSRQQIIYSTSIPKSLGVINKTLGENFGIKPADSEELKNNFNNSPEQTPQSPECTFILSVFDDILTSIKDTIDFYFTQIEGTKVSAIYLTGGGSKYSHFSSQLEKYFSTPSVKVNPIKNIDILSDQKHNNKKVVQLAPQLCQAIGLALWELEN